MTRASAGHPVSVQTAMDYTPTTYSDNQSCNFQFLLDHPHARPGRFGVWMDDVEDQHPDHN